jgi:hypothetical protein
MTLRLLPSQKPYSPPPSISAANSAPLPLQKQELDAALDIAVGDWADGDAIDIDQYRHQMNIWLDDVLSGLVLHKNIAPEDIQIDQAEIGGYRLPLVRVYGRPQAMFWPYLEKQIV